MAKPKVKILGVSAAHRPNMNTAWLVMYALEAAKKIGRRLQDKVDFEAEFVEIADKEIKPCRNCEKFHITNQGYSYKGKPRPEQIGCPIQDDFMSQVLMPKMKEANGFIFGAPTYTISYTSKYRLFSERFSPLVWGGNLTNKPAAAVTVGEMPFGGQESCLLDMNKMIQAAEMIPCGWYMGAPGVSGPPNGPAPADADYDTRIGVKNDKFGRWLALVAGRRVAEIAIMFELAKVQLGPLYSQEYTQVHHPPRGDEPWGWTRLDKEDEDRLMSM